MQCKINVRYQSISNSCFLRMSSKQEAYNLVCSLLYSIHTSRVFLSLKMFSNFLKNCKVAHFSRHSFGLCDKRTFECHIYALKISSHTHRILSTKVIQDCIKEWSLRTTAAYAAQQAACVCVCAYACFCACMCR